MSRSNHPSCSHYSVHVTQRDALSRIKLKDRQVKSDSYKHSKNKRKHYNEQAEP